MHPIKSSVAAAALACLVVAQAMPARAQGVTPESAAPAAPSINITAEQRHVIKEIVLKDLNAPKAEDNAPMQIGAAVPPAVTLHPFPGDVTLKVPAMKTYSYFIKTESSSWSSRKTRRSSP